MSSRAEALVDRADELEQCGKPQAACRAYQAALHLDPHCRTAAVNLGVLLKCVDRLFACRTARRHAYGLRCTRSCASTSRSACAMAAPDDANVRLQWRHPACAWAASGWLARLAHSQAAPPHSAAREQCRSSAPEQCHCPNSILLSLTYGGSLERTPHLHRRL